MLRGVISDVDGTLVLSNDAHARSWVEAFAESGRTVPFGRVRQLIGMGGDKLLATLFPGMNDREPPGKDLAERRKQIFAQRYVARLQPSPGARELVQSLKERGLRVIVASSAKQDELASLLRAARVDDLLTEATTSDDAEQSKPAPDIVSVALERMGLPADQAVMLGDTPYDVEAARRSGVAIIAVRCGGWSAHDLAGARAVYDDPADVLARGSRLFGVP